MLTKIHDFCLSIHAGRILQQKHLQPISHRSKLLKKPLITTITIIVTIIIIINIVIIIFFFFSFIITTTNTTSIIIIYPIIIFFFNIITTTIIFSTNIIIATIFIIAVRNVNLCPIFLWTTILCWYTTLLHLSSDRKMFYSIPKIICHINTF